jgi:hypothetical protein
VVCSSVRLDLMRRFRAVSQEQCKLISLGFKVTINLGGNGDWDALDTATIEDTNIDSLHTLCYKQI